MASDGRPRRAPRRLAALVLVALAALLYISKRPSASAGPSDAQSPSLLPQNRESDEWLDSVAKLADGEAVLRMTKEMLDFGPRVVGTPGHARVREYIVQRLREAGWEAELDGFEDTTPLGRKNFTNIIGRLPGSKAARNLVLACHWESKYFPEPNRFLAATDSACPCAMMLDIARSAGPLLRRRASNSNKEKDALGLELFFFDGEEAFLEWTDRDSLYGARHLAARMEREGRLPSIALFALLDLLGSRDVRLVSHFENTAAPHERLRALESRLGARKHTERPPMFAPKHERFGHVQDDHIPFLRRGVPILHLIAVPFPSVWHTEGDDMSAIDPPSVHALTRTLTAFVVEHLDLA
eukprot:tig00021035_g17252.t1